MSLGPTQLAVFGSINQDITLEVEQFPEPGQTLMAGASHRTTGGKGANQAIAAARSGAATVMLGAVGDDAGGRAALEALSTAGVTIDAVQRVDSEPTGTAYISVRHDGENTIIVDPGANQLVWAGDFTAAIVDSQWCLFSMEVPEQEVLKAAVQAKRQGVRTALNASPTITRSLDPSLFDLLIVNKVEVGPIAGADWQKRKNLADHLGLEAVLVTQGAAGVRTDIAGRGTYHIPALSVQLRDTTGCGDAFAGVVMSSLVAGGDYLEAVRTAVIYAGCVAEHLGAAAAYPEAFAEAARRAEQMCLTYDRRYLD